MELLIVFIVGLLFGLGICLFCDWRSQRRPNLPNIGSYQNTVVDENEIPPKPEGASGSQWQEDALNNSIQNPRHGNK